MLTSGTDLPVDCRLVDQGFRSLGDAGGVEAAGVDAVAAAVVPEVLPCDDEVAGRVHGDRGEDLLVGGDGVGDEFAVAGEAVGGDELLGVDAQTAAVRFLPAR